MNLRDLLRRILTVWASDRPGLNVGFRFLWAIVLLFDGAVEWARQGLYARFPGLGTPTALPYIAADRRTYPSPGESDASLIARLLTWLERWLLAGSVWQLMRELQAYIPTHPKIRVFTRYGLVRTLNEDGTTEECNPLNIGTAGLTVGTGVIGDNGCGVAVFDWDSVSHPERVGWWSEMWIVIYEAYPEVDREVGAFTIGADAATESLRQTITQSEVNTVRAVIDDWKSAHSRVRAVIWTADDTDFDPDNPGTLQPDGTWGDWHNVTFARPDHLRIWEFQNVE